MAKKKASEPIQPVPTSEPIPEPTKQPEPEQAHGAVTKAIASLIAEQPDITNKELEASLKELGLTFSVNTLVATASKVRNPKAKRKNEPSLFNGSAYPLGFADLRRLKETLVAGHLTTSQLKEQLDTLQPIAESVGGFDRLAELVAQVEELRGLLD